MGARGSKCFCLFGQSANPDIASASKSEADIKDAHTEGSDAIPTLSQRACVVVQDALYVTLASASADGNPWASPVAFWLTSRGVCFATSASSTKVANLRANAKCSLAFFDSQAPFMSGFGVQASGLATIVDPAQWSMALQGIRARFPNLEGDAVQMHEALFHNMEYVLVEVIVEKAYANIYDPEQGGDHRSNVDIAWQDLQMTSFSTEKMLCPPPQASLDFSTRAHAALQDSLYATFASASLSNDPWCSPIAFWPTDKGICFAAPASSSKAVNVRGNPKCSIALFDSHAPFMTGFGIQASGCAAIVDPANWRAALQGIRGRFPNVEGDIVEMHLGMFEAMKYVLIEVVLDNVFVNGSDPEKGGDYRINVDVAWKDLCMTPFSTGKMLGPPPSS